MYECTLHMYDSHNDYAKNNDMLHAHKSFIVDFCRYVELEREWERELELNDFERNWNY